LATGNRQPREATNRLRVCVSIDTFMKLLSPKDLNIVTISEFNVSIYVQRDIVSSASFRRVEIIFRVSVNKLLFLSMDFRFVDNNKYMCRHKRKCKRIIII
jgi:hypothetical protein